MSERRLTVAMKDAKGQPVREEGRRVRSPRSRRPLTAGRRRAHYPPGAGARSSVDRAADF